MQPALRANESEYPAARLPELSFVLSREHKLEAVVGLLLPFHKPFVAQTDFDEQDVIARGRSKLDIAI
jgi:hypothetical protein